MVAKRPHKPIISKGQPPAARADSSQGVPHKGGAKPAQGAPSNGVHKRSKFQPAAQRGSALHFKHTSAKHKPQNAAASNKAAPSGGGSGLKSPTAAVGDSTAVNGGSSVAVLSKHHTGVKQQQQQQQQQPTGKQWQHKQVDATRKGGPAAAAAAAAAATIVKTAAATTAAVVSVVVPQAAGPDGQPVKKKKWHPKKRPRAVDPAEEQPAAAAVAAAGPQPQGQGQPKKKHKKNRPKVAGVPGVTTSTALPEPGTGAVVGSNWLALKKVITASGGHAKRRTATSQELRKLPSSVGSNTGPTQVVAMDCEMVGVGPGGKRSALARVCVVNNDGNVLLDTFVCPKEAVTDFRTQYSGVRAADLSSPQAITMLEAQMRVADLMKGRVVVGHALQNDMKALMLSHPVKDIRDTSKYPPLMLSTAPGRKPRARALRHLALEVLGLTIQGGEHSPVDDARCALYLYHRHRKAWEMAIRSGKLARTVEALGKKKAPKVDIYKRDVHDDPLADL